MTMTTIWLQHGRDWHHYTAPHQIIRATTLDEIRPALRTIDTAVNEQNLTAVGFLSYEAAPAFDPSLVTQPPLPHLPLLWFGLFSPPVVHTQLPPPKGTYQLSDWQANQSESQYREAIARIKQAIARGETYQVNHTFRLHSNFSGDPFALFHALVQAQGHTQSNTYAAYLHLGDFVICSVSPELFFKLDGQQVTAEPMKGTHGRGLSSADDDARGRWLAQSPKNRAENVMIVDMIRNDLSRVAEQGTVSVPHLFQTRRYPTLWQMTSTVTANLRPDTTLEALMAALFPCASITGAPKVRTMQLIRQLETQPRGVYCGAIGFYGPQQQAQFNVAIRTVMLNLNTAVDNATYGVGSGVVWDSDSDDEYAECQTKARVLTLRQPSFQLLETLLWEPTTGYFLLDEHLQRLTNSASYFGIPANLAELRQQLQRLTERFAPTQAQRVRLLVGIDGVPTLESRPLPPPTAVPHTWRLVLAKQPINSHNRFLYHKTTQRTVYDEAWQGVDRTTADDVILWNERGELTETTIGNLALQLPGHGQVWYTPPLSSGLLPGTYRAHLLATGQIATRILTHDDLAQARGVAFFNSVRRWGTAVFQPN
ncbi:MAG: aminodeoxychorismate synthase component I [Anaerolineales bacterium]|nr:aminodeoxychorismate synthase component I [Anaerolineales bacterium]